MFGMDSKTLLKKDIIELLDHTDHWVTVEDIKNGLGYSNSTTILEICNELQELIGSLYTKEEFSLTLTNEHRGLIQLHRRSTNFQSLYKSIFSQYLTYDILISLIEKRNLSTIDFCMSRNVSKSTLQRRIKKINKKIAAVSVYIACSEEIYFRSDEILIRIFSYIFLWSTHRQFSNSS